MDQLFTVPMLVGIIAVGALSLLVVAKRKSSKRCISKTDLSGKTTIVTGANTGIGFWTAQDFAARHARVILACRSLERGTAARDKIMAATGNTNVTVLLLDLFDFTSVRRFVRDIKQQENRLDILVNNAGVAGLPQPPSEHGLEVTMAVNHFGHFLLTLLLMDLLKKSTPSRIVNVSSKAHLRAKAGIEFDNLHGEKPKSTLAKYAASKLANLLFTRELARRLQGTGVTAYCTHPGAVTTEIWRNLPLLVRLFVRPYFLFNMKTSEEGAQTSIYVSVSEEVKEESGKYYVDCALAEEQTNPLADDPELASRLWNVSAELTGVSADF